MANPQVTMTFGLQEEMPLDSDGFFLSENTTPAGVFDGALPKKFDGIDYKSDTPPQDPSNPNHIYTYIQPDWMGIPVESIVCPEPYEWPESDETILPEENPAAWNTYAVRYHGASPNYWDYSYPGSCEWAPAFYWDTYTDSSHSHSWWQGMSIWTESWVIYTKRRSVLFRLYSLHTNQILEEVVSFEERRADYYELGYWAGVGSACVTTTGWKSYTNTNGYSDRVIWSDINCSIKEGRWGLVYGGSPIWDGINSETAKGNWVTVTHLDNMDHYHIDTYDPAICGQWNVTSDYKVNHIAPALKLKFRNTPSQLIYGATSCYADRWRFYEDLEWGRDYEILLGAPTTKPDTNVFMYTSQLVIGDPNSPVYYRWGAWEPSTVWDFDPHTVRSMHPRLRDGDFRAWPGPLGQVAIPNVNHQWKRGGAYLLMWRIGLPDIWRSNMALYGGVVQNRAYPFPPKVP